MEYPTDTAALALPALLNRHREEIARTWAQAVYQHASFRPGNDWEQILLESSQSGLSAMTRALATGSYAELENYLRALSRASLRSGFGCEEVSRALLLSKEASLSILSQTPGLEAAQIWEFVAALDGCLRWMIGRFLELYNEEVTRRVRAQHERKLSLLRCSLRTPDTLLLDEILYQAAYSMIWDLGAEYCDFFELSEDQQLIPWLGMNEQSTASGVVQLYVNRPIDPSQDAFLSQVLVAHEPVACYDAQHAPPVNKALLASSAVKSLLAVPLVAHDQVLAVALAGMCSDYREFTGEQIELAWDIARDASLAIENRRLYEKHQLENQSIQRIMSLLLQDLDLEEVLDIVCAETRHLTGARGSAVYFLEEELDREPTLRLILTRGDQATHDTLSLEGTLAGAALKEGRSLAANHPAQDARMVPPTADVINLLATPLIASGNRIGILFAANKPHPFTEDDIRIASIFADQAVIAIEHARLLDKIRYIATLEERERLAREIHDNLAQALSILKLQASNVGELLQSEQWPRAQTSIQEMKRTASEAHIDAREAIFNLHNRISSPVEFLAALEASRDRYQTYGITVRLDVQDGIMTLLPGNALIQITRIIQEALTNVRKHAEASAIWVWLHEVEGQLAINIDDNGKGFEYQAKQNTASTGVGLQVMRERAQSLGGRLEIASTPGQGTRVVAYIPSPDRRP